MNTLGVPNLQKIFLLRNLMTVLESVCCAGIASTHLETYSTATSIYSFEKEDDKGIEPSGVQALKNPNPLKDVEGLVVLAVAGLS